MRLDLYMVQQTKLSRHQVQKMIEEGFVTVNGAVALKPAFKLQGNETVEYERLPPPNVFSLEPEPIPLDVLYEDDSIAVINKPPDLVVHPAAGNPSHTLVNALLHRYKTLPEGSEPFKPGIVHRLDKGTSGVMVVARTQKAMQSLLAQFKNREVEKIYLALVVGEMPAEGTFEKPLGRHPVQRQKISSRTKKGREAKTQWRVLQHFGKNFSWVEIRLHTGRTHQIRVHFAESSHPVVGDPVYGRRSKVLQDRIQRPALHAWRLGLSHPQSSQRMQFEAPLPKDIQEALKMAEC